MSLQKISDDELWTQTRDLAAQERKITLDVLLHLKEVDRRGLHLKRGYPSLYEYAVRELKYAEGAAYRRVQAMRLIRDMPEVEEKIQSGELNLTTAAKVQTASRNMTPLEKKQVLVGVEGKSSREVDRKLTEWQPASAREHMRWLSAEEVQLTVLLDKVGFRGLEELKEIKSHSSPTYGKVVADLVALGQEKWNILQRTAPPRRWSSAQSCDSPDPRYIPQSLRNEVRLRDQNRCTYLDPQTGHRCEAKHFLQMDHIQPVALGGKATLENLRLLCAPHNRLRAEQTFGMRTRGGK